MAKQGHVLIICRAGLAKQTIVLGVCPPQYAKTRVCLWHLSSSKGVNKGLFVPFVFLKRGKQWFV
jgi:hypothetical protein